MEEDEHKIIQGYVVCNYILEDNKSIINSIYKSKFKKDIEDHNIKIIDYTTTVDEIEKVSIVDIEGSCEKLKEHGVSKKVAQNIIDLYTD